MFTRIFVGLGGLAPRPRETRVLFLAWLLCCGSFEASYGLPDSPLPEYQTTSWRVEDGLPQSTVTCIAQSADGYLWLGTQNGLARFDGVRFRVFDENNTPAIKNSRIVRLAADKSGAVWIGTEHGGLVCLQNGHFTGYDVPSRGTSHDYARVFCNDSEDALWEVSCEWQLIRFSNQQFNIISDHWGLPDSVARALACDTDGRIWVGTDNGLAVNQAGRFNPVWGRTNEENAQVDFLAPSRNGGVWAAANGRLRRFAAGRWVADLGAYAWTNRPIYDLYEDSQDCLWVATLGDGLFRFDSSGHVLRLTSKNGLPTDFARCVMEDREGDVWVGTEGGGLCRLKLSKFQTFGVKQGLCSDQVTAVGAARDGGLWVGTDGDGLDHWKDGKVRHYGFKDGLKNGHVWSVLEDVQGNVWAGTWDGIYKWDGGQFNGLSDGQTIGWQVLAMYEDPDQFLWLGQQAFGGVTRLRGSERVVVNIPGTSANLDVRALTKDRAGNLWIGTSEDGLYRMKDGHFTRFGRKDGLGSESIWSLYVDNQGQLWVGSCRGGLSLWQDGRFITWTTKNGLINDVICQIQEDSQGNLWLGSYGGVFRVNKEELIRSAPEPNREAHCVGYNLEDGLPSVECQGGFQPSSYKSPDGRMWFPTIKGLVAISPATAGRNSLPPTVVIEDVITDKPAAAGGGIGLPDKISIPPGNRRIEIQYTAFCFSAPHGARFKYRLEGWEKDWEDAGARRVADYNRLPPANYRFHVIACNGEGVWNETGASLAIAVEPAFWETRAFLVIASVLGLGLVVSAARYFEWRRVRRRLELAERDRAVERERSRIAKDIHDDLGANLTEIVLLSEFAQEPNASKDQVLADMQKITSKAKSLTRMMDEVVWAVNPTNDTLEKFVSYTCSFAEEYLQTAKIACRLEVPEFLPEIILTAESRHNLFLTVKEALNNIVKHAGAAEVKIQVALEEQILALTIQDNGKGFLNGSVVNGSPSGGQKDGLSNMRKRMESIAGRVELSSQPAGGTSVKLMIGLGKPVLRT